MYKSHLLGAVFALLLTAAPFSSAHSMTVLLEFQATFLEGSGSDNNNPSDPLGLGDPTTDGEWILTGWFTYTAADLVSSIDSLLDVGLTIDDHNYVIGDFGTLGGTSICIGEPVTDACTTSGAARDFTIEWIPDPTTPETPDPKQIAYSIGSREYWAVGDAFTDNGTIDYLTLTAIPVPPALWLFGSGLLGLAGIARRRRAA